ncbi:MAG: hypothetical protein M1818_005070 [Claussenomyces sp. TS43310]|nr:MAG: hypothetical protein M1818_005070 [Claussenomyces sp. TS43310]
MSTLTSGIRVFVQWSEQTVFAGENIECQITFKNIAPPSNSPGDGSHSARTNGFSLNGERSRKPLSSQTPTHQARHITSQHSHPPMSSRGHRSTLSLNVLPGDARLQRTPESSKDESGKVGLGEASHRRSVSIISLGRGEGLVDDLGSQGNLGVGQRRPSRGHTRAASLQIVPRRSNGNWGPVSAPLSYLSTTHLSPLHGAPSLPVQDSRGKWCLGTESTPSTPVASESHTNKRKGLGSFPADFKFPAMASSTGEQTFVEHGGAESKAGKTFRLRQGAKMLSPGLQEDIPVIVEQKSLPTRIISSTVQGETPRSSGDFYSLSGNSTETLASEYHTQQQTRVPVRSPQTRRPSRLVPAKYCTPPESLMMGYAQISGSFILDGSLISLPPFEQVKRKGVLGGHGGGVIGVETTKRDSGLLKSFGWGNIGESLNGILGAAELSSMKDIRGATNSKSIPLLSTPQSILFVDLRLAPGEAKSFKYTFKLPRGLPPTHRGKAIKISYSLVIGTQRPGGAREQQLKSVVLPFRVLGSVNSHGELLGHDLMTPYIILRDQAHVQDVTPLEASRRRHSVKFTNSPSTLNAFLAYVDKLLTETQRTSGLGLLSPAETAGSRRASGVEEPASTKEAIDMAIMRSNLSTNSEKSANRFEIARNGRRVAVILLARPAYRLGETITAAIEFTDTNIPCYAVHTSLETCEKVDAAISLRSDASIHRVTRKIYSSHSESTLFARRVKFSFTIPTQATPSFITSGVSFEWKVLIEFVTPMSEKSDEEPVPLAADLLEEISRDERSTILAASERLECESFEVAVPLRVYGALGGVLERHDMPEGLVV